MISKNSYKNYLNIYTLEADKRNWCLTMVDGGRRQNLCLQGLQVQRKETILCPSQDWIYKQISLRKNEHNLVTLWHSFLIFSGDSDGKEVVKKLKSSSCCLSSVYPFSRDWEGWDLCCAMTEPAKEPRHDRNSRIQEIIKWSNGITKSILSENLRLRIMNQQSRSIWRREHLWHRRIRNNYG